MSVKQRDKRCGAITLRETKSLTIIQPVPPSNGSSQKLRRGKIIWTHYKNENRSCFLLPHTFIKSTHRIYQQPASDRNNNTTYNPRTNEVSQELYNKFILRQTSASKIRKMEIVGTFSRSLLGCTFYEHTAANECSFVIKLRYSFISSIQAALPTT